MTTGFPCDVKLLRSGEEFFRELIESIDSASYEIHFQSYILKWDETGLKIVEALRRASDRGVKVYVLLDAYGSSGLDARMLQERIGRRAELRFFGPLFSRGRFHIGRRLHHKAVVIDAKTAIVGGINISDCYRGNAGAPPWLDFAVKIEGTASWKVRNLCIRMWYGRKASSQRRGTEQLRSGSSATINAKALVRPAVNDFLRNRHEIASTYRKTIRMSGKSVDIVSGYFLPGGRMRRILKTASRRGVRIRIVMAARSDVRLARLAREFLYGWMLRNGIEIHEYRPANVHGKVLCVDGRVLSVGSYDLNNLSTYSNIEMNLNIEDVETAGAFGRMLQEVIDTDCDHITIESFRKRSTIARRILCWFCYRLTKTLFGISYLMAGGEDRN